MNTNINDTFPPIITDRYEIIRLLGEGGMSRVYLAQDKQLPRKIAIKCILSELSEKDEVIKRIEREVQTHASIEPHPNIATLFDKIEDSGRTFLIMEYVEGETLDVWSKNHDYSQSQIVSIITNILNALKAIHARNVIHRDIKPENVILSTQGAGNITAKLMDFGISYDENLSSTATKLTQIDVGTPGSPAYMSPEQIDSKTFGDVGPASDLYAVGIIFYELLTKTPPFTGTMTQILTGHLVTVPESENISFQQPFLKTVLLKALSKKQEDRYATAEQFLLDLAAEVNTDIHSDKTQLAVKLDSKETSHKTQLHIPTQTQLHIPTQTQTSSRKVWLPVIMVILVGLGGAAYYMNTTKQQNLTTATENPEKLDLNKSDQEDVVSSQEQENAQIKQEGEDTEQAALIATDDPSNVPSPVSSTATDIRPIDPLNYMGSTPDYTIDNSTGTQATDTFKALREKKLEQTSAVTTQKASIQKKTTKTSQSKKKTTTAKKSSSKSKSSSSSSSGWSVTGSSSNKVN